MTSSKGCKCIPDRNSRLQNMVKQIVATNEISCGRDMVSEAQVGLLRLEVLVMLSFLTSCC